MKAKTLIVAMLAVCVANAQTDVTDTYMQNPDFAARYAGWLNEGTTKGAVGGFTHQTNGSFEGQSGDIYMEKYVSSGSKVSNCNISQVLQNVPTGTYRLTVVAQNIQQSNTSATQTGAYVFAGDEQTEVSEYADYSVTFSVIDGKAKVGFKTVSASGNWVAFDNFHLYQLDTDMDAVHALLQNLVDEATEVLGDGSGNTASELQDAIEVAEGLISASTTEGVQEAALALERATLNYHISNGTGSVPTVETNPFVAMGVTIALGRSTVTNNGATISEQGFCWSTDPEPTVLDNRTTEYFTNNGRVYRMEYLEPATFYYVRAYAITDGWQVAYGDVVKIATKPRGTVSYTYDNAGSTEQNYRINSSFQECVWMYNNITHITGFSISGHYNSGTSTAECSYGGWMSVGPSSDYQQTGTILHETNHGVGVGTTNEWYNNSNLRSNTSTGDWLGSYANEMVQFLQNDEGAYMTGDDTHMWGVTTSSMGMKNWGINGANEDSYSPADQLLYWGNILITHALHIDGLPCSSSVGFASPAYVFEQRDDVKYYIKCEDEDYGSNSFLGMSNTGSLRNSGATSAEAVENDNLAWYITFNPSTGYYTLYNVGTGKYIGVSSGSLKGASSAASIQLMPSHSKCTLGDFSKHSYWISSNKGSYSLQCGSTTVSTATQSLADGASRQRWLIMSAEELSAYDSGVIQSYTSELDELIAHVREIQAVPHEGTNEQVNIDQVDNDLETTLSTIEDAKDSYTTSDELEEAIATVQDALVDFLTYVKPADMDNPFDLSCLFVNMAIDNSEGWSESPTLSYSCMEYWTTSSFDFNQTSSLKLPVGTYQLCAQAFQRPGEYSTVYTDYMQNGVNNVNATLYAGSASALIKNMYDDYQTTSLGSGCVAAAANVYVPNDMYSASLYFAKGLYENSVEVTTTSKATLKIGLKASKPSSTEHYWTIFDNFRLYFLGGSDDEAITPVNTIVADESETGSSVYYDLTGRIVTKPERGIYIQKGKKVLVK